MPILPPRLTAWLDTQGREIAGKKKKSKIFPLLHAQYNV
jgi:hypothetical protein